MSLRNKQLDGANLFKTYWLEMGDARSLKTLASTLPVNPVTGSPITKDAAYKAMWRWACRPENEVTSFEIFRQTTVGASFTLAGWHRELQEKARWTLTKNQYQRWYQQ
jgi:hypothetical protein